MVSSLARRNRFKYNVTRECLEGCDAALDMPTQVRGDLLDSLLNSHKLVIDIVGLNSIISVIPIKHIPMNICRPESNAS